MKSGSTKKPIVVLVHGIWTNARIMVFFERFLRRAGYEVVSFSYSSVRRSPEANVLALHQMITGLDNKPFSIIAHSLGGLLTAGFIQQYHPPNLQRVVMLGSPIAGSKAARTMQSSKLGRKMLGRSADILCQGSVPVADIEVGVISGSQGLGLGRLVTRLDKPCDGAVAVAETRAPWLKDHIVINKSHSGMLFSSQVASKALQFLKRGSFHTSSS